MMELTSLQVWEIEMNCLLKAEGEGGLGRGGGGEFEGASVQADHLAGEAQANPGAGAAFGGEERYENLVPALLAYCCAVVGDIYRCPVLGVYRCSDVYVFRACLNCILDQIVYDLGDLPLVGVEDYVIGQLSVADSDLGRVRIADVDCVGCHFLEIECFAYGAGDVGQRTV